MQPKCGNCVHAASVPKDEGEAMQGFVKCPFRPVWMFLSPNREKCLNWAPKKESKS